MEQSTTGLSTETPTKPTCLHCGKLGHWEDKCWSKNPDQKKAYIEKRYGKKTKKENKNNASTNEVNLPHSDLPIRVAGPSGTKPLATTGLNSDNKGTPPRTDPKKRHPRSPPNYRRSAAKDSKQELAFFGPTTKISSYTVSKSTSLNDLPDELVLKIIEHFDPCQHVEIGEMFAGDEFPQYEVFSDRAVLKKICLSSRRLYSISRPILGRLLRDTGSIKKRHALIRRFIQNPIAASYVRAIFVESFERRPAKMKFLGMGEDIRMAAEKIDMEGKEDWKKHMLYGGKDANVAMLLSLLPKLEFLHFMVETDLANDFPWTLALMRRAAEKSLAPATGPFSSLHAIRTTYVSAHIDPGFGPMGFACAMGLPTLREISVSMAWGNKLNDQHQDMLVSTIGTRKKGKNWTSKIHWPTAVSNVETLEFDDSTLDSEFLRNILTSCKSLQHFTYKWSLDLEGKETDVGFSGLVQSLSTQKHSLETLVLDSANVDWFGRYEHPHLKPIGSLVGFTKLRKLELSGELMIGGVPIINPFGDSDTESESESYTVNGKPLNYPALANIFPPSLETLIINHPGQSVKYFMPLLVEIARACKMEKRLPNLRLVSLEDLVVPQSLKSHQATFDQAEGFLKEVGIDFLPPALAGSDSDTGYRGYSWGGYGGSDDEYWPPSDYSGDSYDFDEDAGFFNFP